MTNTKEKKESKAKSPENKSAPVEIKKGAKKGRIRPRNYNLGNGVYRFSRTRMYHKKAIYKFIDSKTPKTVCLMMSHVLFIFVNITFVNLKVLSRSSSFFRICRNI